MQGRKALLNIKEFKTLWERIIHTYRTFNLEKSWIYIHNSIIKECYYKSNFVTIFSRRASVSHSLFMILKLHHQCCQALGPGPSPGPRITLKDQGMTKLNSEIIIIRSFLNISMLSGNSSPKILIVYKTMTTD